MGIGGRQKKKNEAHYFCFIIHEKQKPSHGRIVQERHIKSLRSLRSHGMHFLLGRKGVQSLKSKMSNTFIRIFCFLQYDRPKNFETSLTHYKTEQVRSAPVSWEFKFSGRKDFWIYTKNRAGKNIRGQIRDWRFQGMRSKYKLCVLVLKGVCVSVFSSTKQQRIPGAVSHLLLGGWPRAPFFKHEARAGEEGKKTSLKCHVFSESENCTG